MCNFEKIAADLLVTFRIFLLDTKNKFETAKITKKKL